MFAKWLQNTFHHTLFIKPISFSNHTVKKDADHEEKKNQNWYNGSDFVGPPPSHSTLKAQKNLVKDVVHISRNWIPSVFIPHQIF